MIDQSGLTAEWLTVIAQQHLKADKILVEKVIRAFLLLEGLVKMKLPFIFKGGTSLLLHFTLPKRFSIDIDIVIEKKPERLDELFSKLAEEQGFTKWQKQERSSRSGIIKEHYRFFYEPLHKTFSSEEYILLDVLYESSPYKKLILLPITSSFVPNKGNPLSVMVPGLEDLLGDKLTAFAPHTTGIPFAKNGVSMSMEIIKQLYDIGNLFDVIDRIENVRSTFYGLVKKELSYRNLTQLTANEVLDDIYDTSLCLITRGKEGKGNFEELQKGIRRVTGFIFSERYHLEKAINHASKAAYLSVLMRTDTKTVEKFQNPNQLQTLVITKPGNTGLNKLRKTDPESFFYWYKIFELLKEIRGV